MRFRLLAVLAVLLSWPSAAAAGVFAPHTWPDARDAPGDPLDIRAVSFGQRGSELWLTVRTYGAAGAGDTCLQPAGLCLGGDGILRRGSAPVPGAVVRTAGDSLTARFHARAAGLPLGRLRWFAETRWRGVVDRAPQRGLRTAEISVLGEPRCFGAAARARARPCRNRALGRTVRPNPAQAPLLPDGPCRPEPRRYTVIEPCDFGDLDVPRAPAVALIGDSHTAHLRSAVEVLAQARGRPAVSLTHAGCAFSTEAYPAPAPIPARCHRHGEEALRWLRAHPSVHTVFTSASAGRGLTSGGFLAMWRRVPRTVHRIYVIRDVPRVRFSTAACVRAVMRRHGRPWDACTVPRAAAILPDPAAAAVAYAPPRVHLIDLTRFFCDSARCFPVVGGVYVYKDDNHINRVFAATLGPYLRPARLRRRGGNS